jgi:DNA polymerase
MLALINLKREDVYIANVAKCRPPKNRDPKPEEVAACWPWLLEQIKIIEPKIIVTLGRHSMNRFFPELKISEAHGQALSKEIPDLGKKVFYVLYHPAAAMYNGSLRQTLVDDFKKIPEVIKKIKNPS